MVKTRVAINGFGRIGRAAFRIISARDDMQVVAINDLADTKTLGHMLKYDSVFRTYDKDIQVMDHALVVGGEKIPVFAEPKPLELPWQEHDIDVVLECTGRFVKDGAAYAHVDAGAKRVIISAPAKGDDENISTHVVGVSEPTPESHHVVSNGSCTTNCAAPVVQTMHEVFGVEKAMLTTIHSYTSTQNLQDGPAKDLRKGRAAAQNMIPTTTGAAIATTKVIPDLKGKFDGMAVRVPTINVSLTDTVFVLKQDVTVEQVNDALREAAATTYKGILGVSDEPLVSSDFIGSAFSSVVDLPFTKVVGGNLVKVLAWYDNEWGYANRLVDMVASVRTTISA